MNPPTVAEMWSVCALCGYRAPLKWAWVLRGGRTYCCAYCARRDRVRVPLP